MQDCFGEKLKVGDLVATKLIWKFADTKEFPIPEYDHFKREDMTAKIQKAVRELVRQYDKNVETKK